MHTQAIPQGCDVDVAPSEQWIHESLVMGHAAVAKVLRTYNEVAGLNMGALIESIHVGFQAAWPNLESAAAPQAAHA